MQPHYPKSISKGMKNCGRQCSACPYIKETSCINIINSTMWQINKHVNCGSYNIIYIIECNKDRCQMRYIGETKRTLKERLADHHGYIVSKDITKATGAHFNLPGHSLANLKIAIIEKVKKNIDSHRKERDKYFISNFNT